MTLLALPFNSAKASRRSALKQLALACGLILSSSSLSALAQLSAPNNLGRRSKSLLNSDQLALLRELAELIIPTTDTPGAIAAGVHDFINQFVVYCSSKAEQHSLLDGFARLERAAQERLDKPFLAASQSQQIKLLNDMERATEGFTSTDRQWLKQLKRLVTFAYYSSEIGASQELAYLAVPGGYKGSFKFKEIGRAWALN